MKNKLKINLIIISITLAILIFGIIILNKTGVINRIINIANKEEIKKEISYEVYHHVNGNTKMLVVAEDSENGIQKIIYPNNEMELYCNGKTKVAFDYNTDITGKESLTFKMVNTLGEEIEKTIQINDEFYLDMIEHNFTKETDSQRVLTVNYKAGSTTKQYRIGDSSAWVNYGGGVRLDDYQILETLGNEIRSINVSLRQVDNVGNEIIVESKLKYIIPDTVTYNQEDTVIEGESIIDCLENNELQSGNYIFRVSYNDAGNTIDYPVELYNYNEDANYITNNRAVIAGRTYTGMGKISSEKRMLILKYNGNLTINNGVVITPQGTNANINGVTGLCTKKGMFIYCAGTLTNNGEITMTAKGTVNQAGENVYLYKNEDGSFEYVPAIGGTGGAAVHTDPLYIWSGANGKDGANGKNRQTGGGGSGGVSELPSILSGTGGTGTSYSGGTGGGGVTDPTNSTVNGSSTGGKGGNGFGNVSDQKKRHNAGTGAGNPGGAIVGSTLKYPTSLGKTGTGGLLILYANTLTNNGNINSNGSDGGNGDYAGGGASGGGSINLFYKTRMKTGNITVKGGIHGQGYNGGSGGNGGSGSITIGNISTGTFVKDK